MANILVDGAGTEAVNGVYTDNLNGTWSKDENYFIFWDEYDTKWTIVFGNYQCSAYDNLGVSPLNKTWYAENGAPPAPTVTEEQSVSYVDGEVFLSSLSYLRTKKS